MSLLSVALAQGLEPHEVAATALVDKIKLAILYPLISLLVGVALLVFLWGVFRYVSNADDETERARGKRNMIFGIVGLFIMLSAVAILSLFTTTFGIN